ncbi:MAG: hypothetical protein V4604_09890 [Bacteroidota bacterium]
MARQEGLTFTGNIDGLSFYHDKLNGYLVRRTGGITSEQYRLDERYAATRDASSEFAAICHTGKLIRDALHPFTLPVKDRTMMNRLNKELVVLKQLDTTHSRGKRRPEIMMMNQEANRSFRVFQFNEHVKTYELTKDFPVIIREQNSLTMKLSSILPSAFPKSATHAGLTLLQTVIDFGQGCFETRSSHMALVSHGSDAELSLVIPEISSCAGIELVCFQVLFFEERNGDLAQLSGKVHSMGFVAIRDV